VAEQLELVGAPHAGGEVHDGEGADDVAVGGHEGARGVGGDAELGDGGVILQPFVLARVAHGERVAARHDEAAKRMGEGRFATAVERLRESDGAVDDLTVGIDEADDGGRSTQHALREEREPIERGIGGSVEQPQPAYGLEASRIADHPFLGVHRGRPKYVVAAG
jgi:hypothetical protein